MVLTGRAAVTALAGLLAVLAFRTVAAVIVIDLLILAAIGADVALAASVRDLRPVRFGDPAHPQRRAQASARRSPGRVAAERWRPAD